MPAWPKVDSAAPQAREKPAKSKEMQQNLTQNAARASEKRLQVPTKKKKDPGVHHNKVILPCIFSYKWMSSLDPSQRCFPRTAYLR
uniref:4F5 domain-containing protein n=1 Tax=Panagrellus redivivus TaxID=6233 RepID=A0A7E4ZXV4_PANRE